MFNTVKGDYINNNGDDLLNYLSIGSNEVAGELLLTIDSCVVPSIPFKLTSEGIERAYRRH